MVALSWGSFDLSFGDNVGSSAQREILDILPAIVFLERDGRVIFANAEARALMGLEEADWSQRPIEDLLWGILPGVAEPRTSLGGNRSGRPFHATLVCSGGRLAPVEGRYEILSSQPREGVVVAHASSRENGEKPQMMDDLLESLPEAVAIVLGSHLFYTNPAFSRMFGFTIEEVGGGNLRDFIVPDTRQHENATLHKMMTDNGTASLETVRMTKDGELVDVALMVAPLRLSGAKAGYIVTYRDIGERKQIEAKLQHDAMHDVLTGLPNRALFLDRMEVALGRRARHLDSTCGVLFLDLDGFKEINDSLGHATGDALLMAVAERLKTALRPQDTAARLGGDEFAILVECILGPEDLEAIAQRVLEALDQPFTLLGKKTMVPISIGAAIAEGEDPDPDAILRDADFAMYQAKQAGGHRYQIFDRQMEVRVEARQNREKALRRVLAQREFEFWYQPFFKLATGKVEGFEALLRRRNADGSVDSFRELLSVAEDTGLSISMNRDAIDAAWRQLQAWELTLPGNRLMLTVNVTHRQFYHDNMVAHLLRILEAGGDLSQLMFEISESAISDCPERALAILKRLVECGVRIAIDNFGSSLAPLYHLLDLPVELVKLDPKLIGAAITSTRHRAVLEGVLHVAKAGGIRALAQGIETHDQFRFAHEAGCELGQGHLLSLPLEASRAQALAGRSRDIFTER